MKIVYLRWAVQYKYKTGKDFLITTTYEPEYIADEGIIRVQWDTVGGKGAHKHKSIDLDLASEDSKIAWVKVIDGETNQAVLYALGDDEEDENE